MTNERIKDLQTCQQKAIEQNKKLFCITFTDRILDPLFAISNSKTEVLKMAKMYIKQWRIEGTIHKCFEVDKHKNYTVQSFERLLW